MPSLKRRAKFIPVKVMFSLVIFESKIKLKCKILNYFYFYIFPLKTPFISNTPRLLEGEPENVYVKCLWVHSKSFREVLRKY